MTFDINWPHGHVTRDGRKARIICTDRRGGKPVVALVHQGDFETSLCYYNDGCLSVLENTNLDLVNAPEPEKDLGWINVYQDGPQREFYKTRTVAMAAAGYRFETSQHHLVLRGGKIVDVTDEEKK